MAQQDDYKTKSTMTAIEWLAGQLKKQGYLYDLDIEAAKQMEKEQIQKAIDDALNAYGIIKTE